MSKSAFKKLSPVIIVDEIEPCLAFWIDRLGFSQGPSVPEGDKLGFVILEKDGIEVMYQTRDSVKKDVPKVATLKSGNSVSLFFEVADVDAVEKALKGLPVMVERRKTFYGTDEIGVLEPGGNVVMFAQPG